MKNLQVTNPNQSGYGKHEGLIVNVDAMWQQILQDDKEGIIINAAEGTLRHEDHMKIMAKLIEVRKRRLNGITDLMSAGLTTSESIGTMLVGTEAINEFQAPNISMNPTDLQNNQIEFTPVYTPLPIIHQGWSIPFRQLGYPYKSTTSASASFRQVAEKLEDMLFNGDTSIVVNFNNANQTIYGYTTTPNRSTETISDWTDLTTNGAKIIPETLAMVNDAFTDGAVSANNSLIMYIANDIWTNLADDYSANKGDRTYIERMEAIPQIREVKAAEKLANGNVLLVEMTDDTVELAVASDIVTVPHKRIGAMDNQAFTTYAAMVPIIKSDINDKTGIVHGSP